MIRHAFFKNNNLAIGFLRFTLFLGCFSCLTQIDLPVEAKGGRLVVSGQISTIVDQNVIELGVTSNTFRLPNPLSDASITLFDDLGGSYVYKENTFKAGLYTLEGYSGIAGVTYHIEILLPNGKKYKSLHEKLPEATQLDSVGYEVVTDEVIDFEGAFTSKRSYKIYINSTIASNNTFVKWGVRETYLLSPTDFPDPFGLIPPPCFIDQNADPQRVTLFDGSTTSTKAIKRHLVAVREVDWTFLERHYFTTYQSAITKDAFEYWKKVNILANQVGSIFDTPPAEIRGNIMSMNDSDEKVLGYFQATNQVFERRPFFQSDLPFPLLVVKCDFDGDFDPAHYLPRCIDCTTVRNSSFIRPRWF